ncbi:MAG: hypothetical protein ACYC63_04825 [Armatimonadota bacterium]
MMLKVTWDKDSEEWIGRLRSFADLLVPGVRGASSRVAVVTVMQARSRMPMFEGAMKRDFRVLSERRRQGNGKIIGGFAVGFTSDTVMPSMESYRGASPFAIGYGKHQGETEGGAVEHAVLLYNPKTKGSTPGRAKLIRYLKAKGGGFFSGLPENASKDDVDKWRLETFKATGTRPRPWVDVAPRNTASDFLWSLMAEEGDPLLGSLVEQVWAEMSIVWSR